jgi:hypothetical protein
MPDVELGLTILDYISALIVIACIASKFRLRWIWLPYTFACASYTVVNIHHEIYGAAGLNAIVGVIALYNYFTDKGDKGEKDKGGKT